MTTNSLDHNRTYPFVYLIKHRDHDYYKIGFTNTSVRQFVSRYRTAYGSFKVAIAITAEGIPAQRAEKMIHDMLKAKKLHKYNEHFQRCEETLSIFHSMNAMMGSKPWVIDALGSQITTHVYEPIAKAKRAGLKPPSSCSSTTLVNIYRVYKDTSEGYGDNLENMLNFQQDYAFQRVTSWYEFTGQIIDPSYYFVHLYYDTVADRLVATDGELCIRSAHELSEYEFDPQLADLPAEKIYIQIATFAMPKISMHAFLKQPGVIVNEASDENHIQMTHMHYTLVCDQYLSDMKRIRDEVCGSECQTIIYDYQNHTILHDNILKDIETPVLSTSANDVVSKRYMMEIADLKALEQLVKNTF